MYNYENIKIADTRKTIMKVQVHSKKKAHSIEPLKNLNM